MLSGSSSGYTASNMVAQAARSAAHERNSARDSSAMRTIAVAPDVAFYADRLGPVVVDEQQLLPRVWEP